METAPLGDGTGATNSGGAGSAIVAELRARLEDAPATKRTAWAETWLRWAETAEPYRRRCYLTLVACRMDAGLDDRPELREPTFPNRPAQSTPPKRPDPKSYRARVHARMRGWNGGT